VALTKRQIDNIAADARNLRDALMTQGTEYAVANEWVKGAMLGILMYETDPPGERYERDHRDDPDAGYPRR
jgi:hypothetical protein